MKKHEWVGGMSDPIICSQCGHGKLCLVHVGGGFKCRMWHNTRCEIDELTPSSSAPTPDKCGKWMTQGIKEFAQCTLGVGHSGLHDSLTPSSSAPTPERES
jgi:hypothetical protein